MKETKELLPSNNTCLDEKAQFECETASNSILPQITTADCLSIFKEISVKNNELCKLKSFDQNECIDFGKGEVNVKTNNEILTKESVLNNIKEVGQLDSTFNSKEAYDTNSINATLNKSAVSDASSSDKEVLQSRHPVQNNVYEDEHDSPTKSASFVSISDIESTIDNEGSTVYNLEVNKRPTIIQATVCTEKKSFNYKTGDSESEINKQTAKSEYQETTTGKANCSFLSLENDNSPIETESNFNQKSAKNNLTLDERRDENEIIQLQEIKENNKIVNPSGKDINDLDSDSIVQDFFNGSFDISAFIPEKTSTMIEDKTIANQWQQMLEMSSPKKEKKYNRNGKKKNNDDNKKKHTLLNNKAEPKKTNKFIPASFAGLTNTLKRKISEKQTENYKKVRTENSENEASDEMPETLNKNASKVKTKTENKYSKAKNQNKRVNKQLKYNEENKNVLKNIDKREDINRKNERKRNAATTKANKNEEIFKDFSFNISPVKKSRNLRNSSLIASKKIKDIGKFENSESFEEILIDSDASCFDFSIKKFDDSFKNMHEEHKNTKKCKQESKFEKDTFQDEDMDIILLDDLQPSFEKEEKKERNRISRSNRKHKTNFENILDACYKTKKHQLYDDSTLQENFILDVNLLDFEEENEETHENHHITKKPNNRPLSKNKKTENKLLEQSKSINKLTNWESEAIDKNYKPLTRSKKKTWDRLAKELLGESNDAPLSNNVTKSLLAKKQTVKKQNTKDADLYSISEKSVMHTINTPIKRNKYNKEKDSQNSAKKGRSDEMVLYKSKNIVEKTLAAMEKCTEKFITPEERMAEKERIEKVLEFDTVYDINSDEEAEFHSNTTLVRNKNEQYYKNEFVTIFKKCNSRKNENLSRNAAQATFKSRTYKQGFSDAEHLVKRSTVIENYSVDDKGGEKVETESLVLVPSTDKKQVDPWSRLIKELNLDQCNDENRNSLESLDNTLNSKQNKRPLTYQENSKKHKDQNKDKEQLFTVGLYKREFYKQDETENEESEPEFFPFDKVQVQSNHTATFNDLNTEDSYTNNESRINNNNTELSNASKTEKISKTAQKIDIKENKALLMKDKNSPKYKIHVEDNGKMKFKQYNKSLSSSSDESEKPKRENAKQDKFQKKQVLGREKYKIHVEDNGKMKFKLCIRSLSSSSDESEKPKSENAKQNKFQKKQVPGREKYRRYLNNEIKKNALQKEKVKGDEKAKIAVSGEKSSKVFLQDKTSDQKRMNKMLIAKNDDDVFSISSSDSETVNKGTGLLCDMFDE